MVDRFLALGGDYFDTAYIYLEGLSEEAIRRSVVERYPRHRFRLANKLPGYQFKGADECRACFDEQLRRCGVDYFDVYLLHGLDEENYEIALEHDQFGFLRRLKASGEAKRIGFSYHDSPALLERILAEQPEVEIVQLQINYLDWDSVSLQARACYEIAVRHGKTVVVMEPVKGGTLASVPEEAEAKLRRVHPEDSPASWAIRFATELEQVAVVLSGMNTMAQMEDNMRSFQPLTAEERAALDACAGIIRANTAVACTGCGYCLAGCPMSVPIPGYFALYNDYARHPGEVWKMRHAYDALARANGRASDCLRCGKCEKACPQSLAVPEYLKAVEKAFEEE